MRLRPVSSVGCLLAMSSCLVYLCSFNNRLGPQTLVSVQRLREDLGLSSKNRWGVTAYLTITKIAPSGVLCL
ncbi:MAG: hypothetical protein H6728_15410 [Myxococcales bacterium]|nr:hypothetical protein [Myxococcales bacterium]